MNWCAAIATPNAWSQHDVAPFPSHITSQTFVLNIPSGTMLVDYGCVYAN